MKLSLTASLCATLLLGGCKPHEPSAPATNVQARLTGDLPENPLAWRAITSWLDGNAGTTSTLYGNDAAVNYARTHDDAAYPAGAVLAVVTWVQRDDPHWFGAKIPGAPQAVEYVRFKTQPEYSVYRGAPLKKVEAAGDEASGRIAFITQQRAAVVP